jgi:O-antigen/teichoic acid export membrane protein
MDLRASARRGVAWNSLAVSGTALVGLAQIAIAARFLDRGDFGLMAMILIVIGFSQNLADLGTANALLHHQQASRRQLESLFWLSMGAGGALFALVAATGLLFARLWSEPALAFWLPISALVFFFGGASQVSVTLLRRELRFRELARIELAAAVVGLALVSGLAVGGFGVAALVGGQLGVSGVRCLLGLLRARDLFVPAFHFAWDDVREMVGFGVYQMGERLVNFASWNLDRFLIALWLGAELLGAYSLAYQLMIRPFRLIAAVTTRVSRPLLARLQHDRERLLAGYFTSVRIVALLAFPLYVGAFLVSDELVAIVYGEGWGDVASLFAILWPLGIVYAIGNPVGALVVATGRTRVGFLWNVFAAAVQLAAVLIGIQFGLRGVALAIVLATLCVIFPCGFYMRWLLARVAPAPFLACLVRPMVYAALMGLGVYALSESLSTFSSGLQLVLLAAAGAAIYAALLWTRERQLLLSLRGS